MITDSLLLNINNIKKKYTKGNYTKNALKGVSLEVFKGEVLALLGVNGAGKTTLSSIIASLHPATEGDILWQGTSIYTNLINYREIVSLCPQQPNFNDALTLEDNLKFAGRFFKMSETAINDRIAVLSKQFGLTEYLKQYSYVLSGGYLQRFMIARSLMHNPKLLILDEPTVGLDPHIRRELWNIIKNLKQEGITTILTTHYLDEAEYLADRVCILQNGQIKLIDKPENLKADFKKHNLEEVFLALMNEQV